MEGIHFILTYKCDRACDHCFVYSASDAEGTFTLSQIRRVLDELTRIGTIEKVFFEGGEPFLFYPVMLEGIRLARDRGFKTGIVTNGYWGISVEDAQLWLEPLGQLQLSSISVSDDALHYGTNQETPARNAVAAADKLGISVSTLATEEPSVATDEQGGPTVAGGVMFRGRAAEKLTEGLPTGPCHEFDECTPEDLRNPSRVHLDAFGNVLICQGISMGNMWQTPLSEIISSYDPDSHPICGPLVRGGPAALVREYNVEHDAEYVSACHCCYMVRRALLGRFPCQLAPRQVYGLD